MYDLKQHEQLARQRSKTLRPFLEKLGKKPPRDLDVRVAEFHEQAFEQVNCLECANCCKTISPIVIDRDIDRMAKHLRVKPSELIAQHLHLDSDGDYVFNQTPCPFLMSDYYCRIYDVRPRACREYPHTDRKRFHQITKLTLKNILVCPAALHVVESLAGHYTPHSNAIKNS